MNRHLPLLWALSCTVLFCGCTAAPVACPAGMQRKTDTCVPIPDAGQISPPRIADSGQTSPPELPPAGVCAPDDAARWASAHRSSALLGALQRCSIAPCDSGECSFSACVAAALELPTCEGCITHELDCLLRECPEECGASAFPSACTHCLCAAGCGPVFDTCAGAPAIACRPCHATPAGCPEPLSPAIIVTAIL